MIGSPQLLGSVESSTKFLELRFVEFPLKFNATQRRNAVKLGTRGSPLVGARSLLCLSLLGHPAPRASLSISCVQFAFLAPSIVFS